jgi:hypothetical protein
MISFAKPLAQALVRDYAVNRKSKNYIRFSKDIFPKASESEKLIFAYGNSMARLAAVFGLSIGECIEDPTVQEVLSLQKSSFMRGLGEAVHYHDMDKTAMADPVKGFDKGGVPDVGALYKALLKGSSVPRVEKVSTTGKVDAEDIAELITYTYVAHQVSKCVVAAASAKKKAGAAAFIKQLCSAEEARHGQSKDSAKKKISSKFTKINENIKGWSDSVSNSSVLVVKTFSDAVAALGKIATGATEGITED